ncbi:eukaryotic translation initiation factor 2-alpha kinase-like [Rhagoletis pomonella]|uniref:eukaryotic translation initiation factor 2-alpha kinase-like n=1 Tax=Rhagoletis pomonella TaxID=28610 RepID=UPI0017810056|nr:eukaryotic translation initiation factor 2-alpha kinase-like [Rhagoletis pomonella]
MDIQNDLNIIRKYRKSLFHLTMITSIVAAATITNVLGSASVESAKEIDEQPMLQLDRRPAAIPYCDDDNPDSTISRRLLYITTLDGRLSALDVGKGGKLRWSVPTGPGPLISSSIHRLELTNNGQFVRMIPSLSGGIYKFDGESIDPIPITTENLLSSSAKFSDDLVISGGKETRTYGVSLRTGQLLYECSMHGCINSTDVREAALNDEENSRNTVGGQEKMEHDPLIDDVMVVRRQTQTVRAVESRTGVERWNFSVGQHELNIIKPAECHDRPYSDMDMAMLDLDIRVVVPEGVICAFSKSNPNVMLWKYKFDHPIVSGWKLSADDELEMIDMFSSAQWMWDHEENIFEPPINAMSPAIYLGMYDKQLYIQESVNLRREIDDQSNLYSHLTTDSTMPIIPWRPIPASSNSLAILKNDKAITDGSKPDSSHEVAVLPNANNAVQGNELVPYEEEKFAVAAKSVLNGSEFVNGNGFYLYAREDSKIEDENAHCEPDGEENEEDGEDDEEDLGNSGDGDAVGTGANRTNRTVSDDLGFSLDDIDAPVKVVILSLWFWWKEVVVIALTTAVLVNLFIGQRQRQEVLVIERHVPVPTAYEATEQSTVALLGPTNVAVNGNANGSVNVHRSLSESTSCSGDNFISRFQSDFDLMRCLGRGGFGVVFEAKNKLDDCKYAVKRITLPNKKESRDRVMREVKTLANCEHQNIVRYFQAWVETPPPGWQEEEDSKWLAHEMSMSIQIETPDGTTLPSFDNVPSAQIPPRRQLQVERKRQLLSWMSSLNNTDCGSDKEHNNCIDEDDDDDSCIVFRSESQSLALKGRDDSESDSEILVGSKNCIAKRDQQENGNRAQTNAISIDIHSNSFDLRLPKNGKNIDYTQLSDSFQIEFVRSANGDESNGDSGCDGQANGDVWTSRDADRSFNGNNYKASSKSKQRPNSLELGNISVNIDNNNSCKALMPAVAVLSTPKPQQNKVYLYIQMQLCRKESLRDWLRENRCESRQSQIASIFHQIVDAVDYVHLKGLIHRDLKPSNIFFSQDGQIKIGDFGLVTDMSDIPNMVTKCGDTTGLPSCARHTQQVGTHLYMSPEQLRGQHYDFKVDIYSLGLIFFELLVFFGTEMERIKTLRNLRDGSYPQEFPLAFPKEHELLKLMLSKLPAERPATAELKLKLLDILKWPDFTVGDGDPVSLVAAAARRYSRSRTFSTSGA